MGLGALFGHFFLYMPLGQSVICIPEKAGEVSAVRIQDLGMTAVFIPDGIDVSLKDKETGKAVACPKMEN